MKTLHAAARIAKTIPPWIDGVVVATACLIAAFVILGISPRSLDVPYLSTGDATQAQYLIKTVLDRGWYTQNPEVGAPFGATAADFPIPEPSHFLLIRLLGVVSDDPFVVFNLFYLVSFFTAALAGWWALRSIGLERSLAVAGAVLFCLLPYHFLRQSHLLLSAYYGTAITMAFAIRLASYRAPHLDDAVRPSLPALALAAIAGGAGIYYAFFGCLFIAAGALIGTATSGHKQPLRTSAIFIAVIAAVVALSLVPDALYHWQNGANPLVAHRQPQESEIYGLRISQLLLPSFAHRFGWLAQYARTYEAHAPLVNENQTATLGALGNLGFLTAIGFALFGASEATRRVASIGKLTLVGLLYATIGGFGALFALFVTPDLRALNRISVMIAFLSIASLLLLIRRVAPARLLPLIAAVLVLIGWFDQIPKSISRPSPSFAPQQAFFDGIQKALPAGTAIYELPYMSYPENPPKADLSSYGLFEPYLRTSGLRWSFGDMRGRPSDRWNYEVSKLDGRDLVGALMSAGFGAIYIDRRGYGDRAAGIEASIAPLVGKPLVENANRTIAVFRIPPSAPPHPVAGLGPGRGWLL